MIDRRPAVSSAIRERAEGARRRPAPFGPDVDPASFGKAPERRPVTSLGGLSQESRDAALAVGVEAAETNRSGSVFQIDRSIVYSRIRGKYLGRMELLPTSKALEVYDGLGDYLWRALDVDLDRYTAAAELERTGGFFLRVLAGERIEEPLQACLLLQENDTSQNVHNVIVLEEGAELQLITGCTLQPWVRSGLHIGVTEVFLGAGASLSDTRIHNWSRGFHVRPRTGVVARERSAYFSNYILLYPVRSEQVETRVKLEGAEARAQLNNVVVGLGESILDVGSRMELVGRGTRAESTSRAIARDSSRIYLRGSLVGRHDDSRGHLDCRGMLLSKEARIDTVPELTAENAPGSQLSHEAAIGPVAEEAVEYLMTRGLRRDEAVSVLTRGFVNLTLPGLPEVLATRLRRVIAATATQAM